MIGPILLGVAELIGVVGPLLKGIGGNAKVNKALDLAVALTPRIATLVAKAEDLKDDEKEEALAKLGMAGQRLIDIAEGQGVGTPATSPVAQAEPVSARWEMVHGIPRRHRLDLITPTEQQLFAAIEAVERLGADVKLTRAVVLLGDVRNLVADFIEQRR